MVANTVYAKHMLTLETEKVTFAIELVADTTHQSLIFIARMRLFSVNVFNSV